jgi:demethylmenaquinone methyltransferase/2-methoxy-6-polyprenyl-1,4-benzoquinol methylase
MVKHGQSGGNHPASGSKLIQQMNQYYDRRAPWHDSYMGYTSNAEMELLLAPLIRRFEKYIANRDVLEIACGTGNWTQVLARRARSVTATDVNLSALDIARTKPFEGTVTFEQADAYALEMLTGRFDVAFAGDWLSHVPKGAIPKFIRGLHERLQPEAKVIFLDMMPCKEFDAETVSFDCDGNRVSERTLLDGDKFFVVKNFPREDELRAVFAPFAADIEYYVDEPLKRWLLIYTRN